MSYITLFVKLQKKTGAVIKGQVVIRDGLALSVFSDPALAKKLYEADKARGYDVYYNSEKNAYIQRFKGMKRAKILAKIKKEIEEAGGTLENDRRD